MIGERKIDARLGECIAHRRKLHPLANGLAFLHSTVHLTDVVSQGGLRPSYRGKLSAE